MGAEMQLLKSRTSDEKTNSMTAYDWLDSLKENGLDKSVFKDFSRALRLFSTIPVTSCSCERTFSKLAHVKTKLRSMMSQERLCWLMLPFVEQDLATSISFDNILKHFTTKTRKLLL